MKKKILSIGSLATVAIPLASAFACGSSDKKETEITYTLQDDVAKLQNIDTIKAYDDSAANFKDKTAGADVQAAFDALAKEGDNYKVGAYDFLSAALTDGVTVQSVVVKTAYDDTTKNVVVTVTLQKGDKKVKSNTADITVGFSRVSLATETAKLHDFSDSKTVDAAVSGITFSTKKPGDAVGKADFLNLEKAKSGVAGQEGAFLSEALGSSVSVLEVKIKTAYNSENHTIVFTVTLTDSNNTDLIKAGTNVKDITVTFAS